MKVWCVLENSLHIYIKIVNKLVDDGSETGKAYLSIWSICLSSEARLVGNQAPLPFPFLSFLFLSFRAPWREACSSNIYWTFAECNEERELQRCAFAAFASASQRSRRVA